MASPLSILDSHQHFWAAAPGAHAHEYLPADYLAECRAGGLDVRATVFVECLTAYDHTLPPALRSTGETRFAAGLGAVHGAKAPHLAAAIIANADPLAHSLPFADVLDAHVSAGAGRLRGIRRCAAWDADPALTYAVLEPFEGMLRHPRYAEAARILAARDLLFETWLYHPQLEDLADLAASVPACTFVLDHAGTPLASGRYAGIDPAPAWREGIARLAERPNVHVKLGGLITPGGLLDQVRAARGLDRWTRDALAEALAPWVGHLVACFGADRCLFESNFPVDRAHCDLATLVHAYADATAAFGVETQQAIMGGNAARLYRIAFGASAPSPIPPSGVTPP